ncbi:CapA family protein [Chloroflexota bacterium]
MEQSISIYAVGDIKVDRDNPESIMAKVAPTLKEADITFAQLEMNLSERGTPAFHMSTPLRCHPRNVKALTSAGIDIVSFASNHTLDWGPDALMDTIDIVKKNGMDIIGAGSNIEEARRPSIIERKGTKVAFLAYNSLLPPGYVADAYHPGCAPMRIRTMYEPIENQPAVPARILSFPYPEDLEAMKQDIAKVRPLADVVVVSMHWGIHFQPATIAMYQKTVGRAAIDAGADIILGHHAHILKGIDVYQGKVIFYSLGNFAMEILYEKAMERAKKYPIYSTLFNIYGWKPDPAYPRYAFPADSRKTIIAKIIISDKKIAGVSFLPAMINPQAEPEILPREDKRFDEVVNYMKDISENQDLNVKYTIKGNEVVIS